MNQRTATALAAAIFAILSPAADASSRSLPVPLALQGRWAADFKPHVERCHPEFPDDFMWSFTADHNGFRYWEARATPTAVRRVSENDFVLDLAYAGEGEVWRERRSFRLEDHGRTLFVDKAEPSLGLRQLRYRRCGVRGYDRRGFHGTPSISRSSRR